jgi:hypothetical protein
MGDTISTQVKTYVEGKVGGKAVGDGECFALADHALKAAGAKSAEDFGKITPNANYVWGSPVSLENVRPGDILQFRNYYIKVETETDSGSEWHTLTRPHHTAIVVAVNADGSVVVAEQNVDPDRKKVLRDTFDRLAAGKETRSLPAKEKGGGSAGKVTITVKGVVKAYRPVSKGKTAALFQQNFGAAASRQMLAQHVPSRGGPKRLPGPTDARVVGRSHPSVV